MLPIKLAKYVLGDILRFIGISQHSNRDGHHRCILRSEERLKCRVRSYCYHPLARY
jgi:hypothetical protein